MPKPRSISAWCCRKAAIIDDAMRAYAQAYRLRPSSFGTIAMALTSAPHGRLWLDEAALRRSLDGHLAADRPRRARKRLR